MQAVCPKCNTLNPISNQFCGNCGASLESAKVVQEAQPAKVESRPKRSNLALLLILLIAFVCVVIWLLSRSGGNGGLIGATPTPVTWLTLDGKEADGTLAVTQINVWKDYDNRGAGIAGVGQHGQRVKLIRRSGDAVKIELPNGAQGWVTYYFIKEYK